MAWLPYRRLMLWRVGDTLRTSRRTVGVLAVAVLMTLARPSLAPGFEGFGAATPGGAGGAVYRVTSLADSGAGTLRDAVSEGHRTIVFDVVGEIQLTSPIFILGSFVTIDGSSAPPPGITLVGGGLIIRGNVGLPSNQFPVNDIIVRGLRIHDAPIDGIQIANGAHNIVIDHVSVRDTGDGLIDITEHAHDVTVSWSILAGGSKAMLVKYNAYNVTLHHNLWVHARNRNPAVAVDDLGTPATTLTADIRNNLVWDWLDGVGTAIHHGAWANVVANFYSSPASSGSDQQNALIVCSADCGDGDPAYIAHAYTTANVSGTVLPFDINGAGRETAPFPASPVTIDDACTAASAVLAGAGVRPLDAIEAAYLDGISFPICRRTATTLTASVNPVAFGAPVTFTATVQPVPPAVAPVTGTVTFRKGSVVLGTAPILAGSASLAVATLEVGTSTVTATYSGSAELDTSVGTIAERVIGTPTITTIAASANPIHVGDSITLSATVVAAPPSTVTPGGSARFYDGSRLLATKPLADGTATFTTTTLAAGFRTMTARYVPAPGFEQSSSSVLSVGVEGGTTTALTRSLTSIRFGQSVTLRATVTKILPGTGIPDGAVTFRDGTTTVATQPLSNGIATFTTDSLAVGTHPFAATYGGDANFVSSVSAAANVKVLKGSTKVTLSASSLSLLLGQLLHVTATVNPVAPSAGVPTGSVRFKDNGTTRATLTLAGGSATFSTVNLAVGAHGFTAAYLGSSSYSTSTSGKITVTVRAP
jgi:hypothetical protein